MSERGLDGRDEMRTQLDSVTMSDLDLEFEELVPDTLRSPPMDYPEMPAGMGQVVTDVRSV